MSASVESIRVVPAAGQAIRGVGKYRYIAMLAEGGMADVYLAVTQNAGFEKLVVIKQLRDTLAEDPTFVAMFMDEARLAARLNHPNVVQTLEVGTDSATGLHFIAMEFLEGVPHVKFARLKDRVPPPLAFHLRILVDVLRGLHYAHELCDFDGKPLKVVHRDVSPQNVVLTFAGGVKILDFGIAKAALAAEQRPEDFKGKLEYMAPEQASRQDVDRRADVFSVGVMLFEALTRRRLYKRGENKLQQLVSGTLPSVLDVAPSTPRRLAAVCAKAMAHDRDDRYPTADAMADDLEDWLDSTTQHVSARDVGSCVAEKFAGTRAKLSAAIEAQLMLFRSLPESAPDTIPISRLPFTDIPTAETEPPPALAIPPSQLPEFPNGPNTLPLPNVWPYGATSSASTSVFVGNPGMSGPNPTMSGTHTAVTVPPVSKRGREKSFLLAAGGLLSVLLIGVAVALAARGKVKKASSDAALAAASASSSAAASSTPAPMPTLEAQIELTIKASPPEARILVDGKALASNPVRGTHPRDGAIHHLRIEAPGYEPREESIGFDRSILMNIELHPLAATVEVPATGGRTVPQGRTTTRPSIRAPRPHSSTSKPLDSENPYQ